jgi:enoyl-CoA hydratase/carnithine racemase
MQQIDSVADLSPLLTTLLVHVDADGICVLTLNRPTRRNGFNLRMSDELVAFFAAADVDAAVKAIVLTGGAGDFFCAGADLDPTASDLSQADSARPVISAALSSQLDRSHTGRDLAGRVVLSMLACRKVCIAALNGTAVGVGITMALSADFRFVAEDAKIGFVFTRRGLAPEGCSTVYAALPAAALRAVSSPLLFGPVAGCCRAWLATRVRPTGF